jgi:diguanylate cyclase (GGDEF)-like protein/PAS domain S-box-containing protein
MREIKIKTPFSIMLALLGGLGIIFLLAYQASSNFTASINKARADNLHTTFYIANKLRTIVREVDLTLIDLAESTSQTPSNNDDLSSRLQRIQQRLPQLDNLALIDSDGKLSLQLHNAPALSLEQDYFNILQNAPKTPTLHTSSPGNPLGILIAQQLERDGSTGLFVARIGKNYLQQLVNHGQVQAGQSVYILDQHLKLIAQFPASAPEPHLSAASLKQLNTMASSAASAVAHTDSATEMLSLHAIPNSPLIIMTRNSADVYLAEWKRSVLYYIGAGLVMLVLTLLMAFYFWRSQRLTSNLKAKEIKLSASEARFRQMIETTPVGLVLVRMPDFFITYINQPAAKMFGWPQAAALSKRAHELYYDRIDFLHHSDQALSERPVNNAECLLKHKEGTPFWASISMSASKTAEGTTLMIGLSDITQRKRLEDELKRRATTDSLSGLANRACFMDTAQQEITRAKRYQHPTCILMMDIDFFKKVNDQYGHQTGDTVIKVMANLCRASLRDNDVLARIGGEEFAALLPETTLAKAYEVAERLRNHIAEHRIPLDDGSELRFTTSIGISELHIDDVNVEAPLKRADQALYASKHGGRNRTSSYTAPAQAESGSNEPAVGE